jgi:inorganic pyrophosphatase/exopolyphosphatase
MSEVLVTCNKNPDLDGSASAFAYAEFLQKTDWPAEYGFFGHLKSESEYIFNYLEIEPTVADKIVNSVDKVVITDASSTARLSKKIDPDMVIEILDHRKVHDSHQFKNARVQIELAGACATLIAEKFIKSNIRPSKESAILLYLAICSNTIDFKNKLVTSRDIEAAKYLKTVTDDIGHLKESMFRQKSEISQPLKEIIEEDFSIYKFSGKKITIFQLEIYGVDRFISKRKEELFDTLKKVKNNKKIDFLFLTCIDIQKGENTFVADDPSTQKMLEDVLPIKFKSNIAKLPEIIMRKELMPKIKECLEKNDKQNACETSKNY